MAKKQVTIPIFIPHLGCGHSCVFCNQWSVSGSGSLMDMEAIRKKIDLHRATIPGSVTRIELAFFGGSFTGMAIEKQEELLSLALEYRDRGIVHGIRLSTRPDYIDGDTLEMLKKYRVTTVELGAQSFFDDVLEASARGHSASDTIRAVKEIKKIGFQCVIQLMPGLPLDSEDRSVESARIAAGLAPAGVRIYPVVVIRNTELEKMFIQGRYRPLSLEEAIELCKKMVLVFDEADVPVIRLGLHPLSPEEAGDVIAGPYHPALGHLVKSRIRRDDMVLRMKKFLNNGTESAENLTINIPSKNREEYLGHKKENISFLKKTFSINTLEYTFSDSKTLVIYKKGQRP